MELRDYQKDAVDACLSTLNDNRSALAVMATGLGKTIVFSEIARRRTSRVMVMAHTTELIDQARDKIRAVTGEVPEVEMGERRADTSIWNRSRIVVTSVQTQSSGRMKRFSPDDFDMLIVDEAHRADAGSYRKVIEHYAQNPMLRVLGVTATPRKTAMFGSLAYRYGISDGINDGWLVPIHQRYVEVGAIEYDKVGVSGEDFSPTDLAAMLDAEEVIHGTVVPVLDIYDGRSTLVFAAGVHHSERLTEAFNRYEPGIAASVSGKTPPAQRDRIVEAYRDGRTKILCNCGVFTEGFDAPDTGVIVMARATKSRILYAQMIGRGTRPGAGTLDGVEGGPQARRSAISGARKTHLDVIDFVGNSSRHSLVSIIDVLRPDISQEARDAAKAKAQQMGVDPLDVVDGVVEDMAAKKADEEAERMAKRARIMARVDYADEYVDPFGRRGHDCETVAHGTFRQPSEGLLDILSRNGIDGRKMNFDDASRVCREIIVRSRRGLCSYKQAKLLARHGINAERMTRSQASAAIDSLKSNGWRHA